jgi:replicative DNA helicase
VNFALFIFTPNKKSNVEEKRNIGYLGSSFQLKSIWQLLTDNKFASKVIDQLKSSYYDDSNYKQLVTYIKDYYDKNEVFASIKNESIVEYINQKFGQRELSESEMIQKEVLIESINKIKVYDEKVRNGELNDDSEVVKKQILKFIQQQIFYNLGIRIISDVESGVFGDSTINSIDDMSKTIAKLDDGYDDGENVFDGIDEVLDDDFREPIATGIGKLDLLMGGGLGKGEVGMILAPLGSGKTTLLTMFAHNAHRVGKNVLQIFLEDTPKQIKRKHFAKISGVKLSEIEFNKDYVKERVTEYYKNSDSKLVIKRYPQEGTTIPKIRRWILDYQRTNNIKFDIVLLDYIDVIESHRKNVNGDALADELHVFRAFEDLIAELDVPGWSAIQGNRNSIAAEIVDTDKMGGNIKKAQKTHFLMSVARPLALKKEKKAKFSILKSRFGGDGEVFDNSIFDHDRLFVEFDKKPEEQENDRRERKGGKTRSLDDISLDDGINPFDLKAINEYLGE